LNLIPHGSGGPFGRLLLELDLKVKIAPVSAFGSFWLKGRQILSSRYQDVFNLLTFKEKSELAKMLLGLKIHQRLSAYTSFGGWIREQSNSELINRLVRKSINFALSVEPEEVAYNEIRAVLGNFKYYGFPALIGGGCQNITAALALSIIKDGGRILTCARAEEIIFRDGRIGGVAFLDRQSGARKELKCRNVISDAGDLQTARLISEPAQFGLFQNTTSTGCARGFRAYFISDQPLMEHSGIMYCLDSEHICALTQPTNGDPSLAPENKHLIITYQIPQTTDIEMETAAAVSDLKKILGYGFQDHCRFLTAGYFDREWPVNRARQGCDSVNFNPVAGLFMVGDQYKPAGFIMAEGVAQSVIRVLEIIN
jgi:phytoene dehydrogenase-like protein